MLRNGGGGHMLTSRVRVSAMGASAPMAVWREVT